MTRGHNACHAATKQLIQGVEPQMPITAKKKNSPYSCDRPKDGQPWNRGAADSPNYIFVHKGEETVDESNIDLHPSW